MSVFDGCSAQGARLLPAGCIGGEPADLQSRVPSVVRHVAGDAATDWLRLGAGPIYGDVDEGMRSLRRPAELPFEMALFARGRPLTPRAAESLHARFARA